MQSPDKRTASSTPGECPSNSEHPSAESTRRGFLTRFAAGCVGLVVGLVPLITGIIFFLDPLLRKRRAKASSGGVEKDEKGFLNLGISIEALPADGTPQLVKVHDDVVDAWNKFLNVEVGSVWLRRISAGGENEVVAFSSVCPHLGCAVDYRSFARDFYCPCHTSTFDLDGTKKNDIPPRNMDRLLVRVKNGKTLWIKYVKYRSGTPEQIVES